MKTIMITGANQGLGLEFVRQLNQQGRQIIATCRTPQLAQELGQLAKNNSNILIAKLDVTNDEDIKTLASELKDTALDWLINNAGISGEAGVTVGNIARENFLHVFNVNCLSALKVSEIFLPHLLRGQDKLIVNLSSQMGSISDNQYGGSYAYRTSKAALNCVMRSFALDMSQQGIKVMLLNPGWVSTRLGGAAATLSVQSSVSAMLKVIEKYRETSHAEVLRNYDEQIIKW